MYFLKKNKCKSLHHLYITTVYLTCKEEEIKKITENRIQTHPVGIWPPLQPSWSRARRQKPFPPLQINLKASHHHPASPGSSPQCYQHPETVSQLLACTEGCKSIPKESKTPPKYFHYAEVGPAPSLFKKSC